MKTNHYIKGCASMLVLLLVVASSCKKSRSSTPESAPDSGNSKQTLTTNRAELTKDSLFLYAQQIYYWNDALPSYDDFNPRQYTTGATDLDKYDAELFGITQIKKNPANNLPYEYLSYDPDYPKYSYIDDITTHNPVVSAVNTKASVDLEGNGNDLGIRPIFYLTSNSENGPYLLFITAVDEGSDAAIKGVKRGWLITKINGVSVGSNYTNDRNNVNASLAENSATLEGFKYEGGIQGDPFTITLNKTSYKSNPIYASKIITAGNKEIGYLAYARFSNETNSEPVLDAAFDDFATQGVTDLIIDLRYNGGGYVNTAEYLVNLIAPATATGVMYKEYFNATLQNKKALIMKNQPLLDNNDKVQYQNGRMLNYFDDQDYSVAGNTYSFKKAGNLTGITNVVFIVSGNTASASELVINCLKPKMNVKLVGDVTYGKPVGFFPIRLENRYDVYFSLFETKNSLDQGGYYTGMVPDYGESNSNDPDFFDDPRYDFGDKNEAYLAKAIDVLNPPSALSRAAKSGAIMSINGREVNFNSKNLMKPLKENDGFKGMIENRHAQKK